MLSRRALLKGLAGVLSLSLFPKTTIASASTTKTMEARMIEYVRGVWRVRVIEGYYPKNHPDIPKIFMGIGVPDGFARTKCVRQEDATGWVRFLIRDEEVMRLPRGGS